MSRDARHSACGPVDRSARGDPRCPYRVRVSPRSCQLVYRDNHLHLGPWFPAAHSLGRKIHCNLLQRRTGSMHDHPGLNCRSICAPTSTVVRSLQRRCAPVPAAGTNRLRQAEFCPPPAPSWHDGPRACYVNASIGTTQAQGGVAVHLHVREVQGAPQEGAGRCPAVRASIFLPLPATDAPRAPRSRTAATRNTRSGSWPSAPPSRRSTRSTHGNSRGVPASTNTQTSPGRSSAASSCLPRRSAPQPPRLRARSRRSLRRSPTHRRSSSPPAD